MRPILLDTTLRDGEQSPGVYFTHNEKLHIASCLDRLGIAIIEAGIPSMGEEELKNLRALQGLGLKAEIMRNSSVMVVASRFRGDILPLGEEAIPTASTVESSVQ